MVEKDREFWNRYPVRYRAPGGHPKFFKNGELSEDHQKWIKDEYFELVGSFSRYPRYTNKRGIDPQVKMFLDKHGLEIQPGWELPVPNQEAAYKSLAKYGKATVNMDPQNVRDLNLAFEYMENHFMPYMHDSEILSLDAAIQQLDRSTSSGCPFNSEYTKKGELLDNDPLIVPWLEADWIVLGEDPNWTTIFSSSLKEELRPDEKIAENSQRTFAAGAIDATTHGTRLFQPMNQKMYDSHLKTSSAVGMSPLKGNWDKLYQKLSIFKNGYALDESQYDSSLRSFLMWGCALFRWKCLKPELRTPENLRRVRTYYRNLINTVMLTPEGILLLKKLGNPSGSVNTVTDNTLILYWILAYAWIKTVPEEFRSYKEFELNTSKALLGDDNTWTVSDDAHPYYNGRSVIEVWKTLGITTTTDSLDARLPEDLDFLSAHTVLLNGLAVPLYDRNKLMKSLLYAPKLHLTPETTLTRVTCLLQIGWTDLPFRKFCREVIDFLLERYDETLREDERWIIAKTGIKTDDFYYKLFTGERLLLKPQCFDRNNSDIKCCGHDVDTYCVCECIRFKGVRIHVGTGWTEQEVLLALDALMEDQEALERSKMPDKAFNMSAKPSQQKKNKSSRSNRRGRGPKKGQATGRKTLPVTRNMRRANRRRGGRGNAGPIGPARQGNLTAFGRTSFNGNSRTKTCTIQEDEFIGAITSGAGGPPTPFNVVAFALNPGQAAVFPWLSKQAAQWEHYTFEMLEFYYKREVSEFATAGTTGKVIMSCDYDASDSPPATKQQMEDTIPHQDAMPSSNLALKLQQRNMHPAGKKYVRPGGLPGAADIKMYDAGILFVATQAIAAATTEVGELRVRYRVKFETPILESSTTAPANNQVSQFTQAAVAAPASGVATVLPLATAAFNGLNAVNTGGSVVLPSGNYLVDCSANIQGVVTALVQMNLDLQKNGVSTSTSNSFVNQAANLVTAFSMSTQPVLVQSNGTDAFTLNLNATYTGGAGPTVDACMRITAV